MSGIEVAGIALAVFPILVQSLDQVVSGIETIRRWQRYRIKLREYADVLETSSTYFSDTLYELLGDIVHSGEELTLLLDDPRGPLWRKPEYEVRLQERLDRSYNSYSRTVKTLNQALQSMCQRLGVDQNGEVVFPFYFGKS